MGTAKGMVDAMRSFVGTKGRPNVVTRAYAARNGSAFLKAAWCDMTVTEAARKSGNHSVVCPNGDRAYTVWHAQDFQKLKRWYAGTAANVNKAKAGDIVFFDWGGSDSVGAIDHVGVVVKALGGGYVETIEGNTGDACAIKRRHYSVIAGYGRPAYSGTSSAAASTDPHTVVKYNGHNYWVPRETLRKGDTGEQVKRLQNALNAAGLTPKLKLDGDFGSQTANRVNTLKGRAKLTKDGVYGTAAHDYLVKTLKAMEEKRTAPKPAPKPTTKTCPTCKGTGKVSA